MTKVFDCFMFFNEWELLETRLRELLDVVDRFLLVEANLTHTGNPKPFHYTLEHMERIPKELRLKVIPWQVILPAAGPEPWFGWGREITQRTAINGLLKGLDAQDDDIVITGDVDEIPRARVVAEYGDRKDICCLEERNIHYNLNTEMETPTLDPKICRYRHVRERGVSDLRYLQQAEPLYVIRDAGWHLSFMGGTEKVIEKMKAYAHYDIREPRMEEFVSRENVERSIRERKSLFQRGDIPYRDVPAPADLPRHITENLDRFRKMGWIR